MSFKDKVYTVTGAASGMGLELTTRLLEAGAIVYGGDVNEKGLEELRTKCKKYS